MDSDAILAVCTTFFMGARLDPVEDVVLASSDNVTFYTHAYRLLAASNNGFNHILPLSVRAPVQVPEPSAVLNLVLHAVHQLSCAQLAPAFAELAAAVSALAKYGICTRANLEPQAPLAEALFVLAPIRALDIYTLAAGHDSAALAVAASAHLLSFALSSLTDETAARIGGTYLKKLFFLHLGRVHALKRLLIAPPSAHLPKFRCGYKEHLATKCAWELAAAYVSWDATPDMSTRTLSQAFDSLGLTLTCPSCKTSLNERVKSLTMQWSMVKVAFLLVHVKRIVADLVFSVHNMTCWLLGRVTHPHAFDVRWIM